VGLAGEQSHYTTSKAVHQLQFQAGLLRAQVHIPRGGATRGYWCSRLITTHNSDSARVESKLWHYESLAEHW
jgi:hypothetical protein